MWPVNHEWQRSKFALSKYCSNGTKIFASTSTHFYRIYQHIGLTHHLHFLITLVFLSIMTFCCQFHGDYVSRVVNYAIFHVDVSTWYRASYGLRLSYRTLARIHRFNTHNIYGYVPNVNVKIVLSLKQWFACKRCYTCLSRHCDRIAIKISLLQVENKTLVTNQVTDCGLNQRITDIVFMKIIIYALFYDQ